MRPACRITFFFGVERALKVPRDVLRRTLSEMRPIDKALQESSPELYCAEPLALHDWELSDDSEYWE